MKHEYEGVESIKALIAYHEHQANVYRVFLSSLKDSLTEDQQSALLAVASKLEWREEP